MPDTPNAGTGTVQAQIPPRDAASGAVSGSQSPDQLAAALTENKTLRERYDNLQRKLGEQGQEIGRLRQQSQTRPQDTGYDDDYGQPRGRGAQDDPVVQQLRAMDQENSIIRYRQEVPDWTKYQSEVDAIVNDEHRVYEVVAWKPDGFGNTVVDWRKTYMNAKERVELEQYRKAQAGAQQSQQRNNEQRTTLQQMATLSGTTSVPPQDRELTLDDLRGKSAEEIAKMAQAAGLVPPSDPLR
jgi:hypothetical protein